MNRKEVLESPDYWTSKTQIELYKCAKEFMERTGKDKTRLAEYLGVSKGYVSQLLNGDYDHRMSKFFELALAFGVIPQIDFVPIDKYVQEDYYKSQFKKIKVANQKVAEWNDSQNEATYYIKGNLTAYPLDMGLPKKVA